MNICIKLLIIFIISMIVGCIICDFMITEARSNNSSVDKTFYTGNNGTIFFVVYKDNTSHYVEKQVDIDTWYSTNFGTTPQHMHEVIN